ncbi:HAD family phosphatase [Rhizobium sp. CNPSo 4039]|uniref:HAD family hydrolase n=1 Tax=Rhizobium sp. CNPSo 4039 TaxID=3021409 RepID=UPI00254F15D0|nr:HAD family phosphatase [Rhizobium sp. CNPSo 4039]MDK4716364.1 HAD family phosphatase [Rhizobium sp. CNPSo 4039]
MIKAVAWDVDGTLIDSEPVHHKALMAVSGRYGVNIAANDTRFIGVAMSDVWTVLAPLYPPGLGPETWISEIVEAYIERTAELQPIAGAPETVLALAEAGLVQCAVSNSSRRIVEANLKAMGLDRAMAFAIGREDVVHGKPDPEPYRLACERLGLDASHVLAVEDSIVGAASARAAGMPVLRCGADFTDFSALLDLVEERRLRA